MRTLAVIAAAIIALLMSSLVRADVLVNIGTVHVGTTQVTDPDTGQAKCLESFTPGVAWRTQLSPSYGMSAGVVRNSYGQWQPAIAADMHVAGKIKARLGFVRYRVRAFDSRLKIGKPATRVLPIVSLGYEAASGWRVDVAPTWREVVDGYADGTVRRHSEAGLILNLSYVIM